MEAALRTAVAATAPPGPRRCLNWTSPRSGACEGESGPKKKKQKKYTDLLSSEEYEHSRGQISSWRASPVVPRFPVLHEFSGHGAGLQACREATVDVNGTELRVAIANGAPISGTWWTPSERAGPRSTTS